MPLGAYIGLPVLELLPNKKIKLDIPSLLLSVIGFGLFLLGFTNVSKDGWGDITSVILPISSGIILLVIFSLRQLKLEEPFVDIRVFKVRDFTIPSLALILVTMAMYGVEMMLPTYLQQVNGLSPLDSGLTLFAGALMVGVVSAISGTLYNKVGIKRLAFVGFIILTIGSLPFAFLSEGTPSSLIVVLYAIRMVGIAMTMMPLTTRAMAALPTEMATHGTTANNTVRQISSSIVIALLTSLTQNVINNNAPAESLRADNPMLYADKIVKASMDGFRLSFAVGLLFAIIGIFFTFFLRNEDSKKEQETNY